MHQHLALNISLIQLWCYDYCHNHCLMALLNCLCCLHKCFTGVPVL